MHEPEHFPKNLKLFSDKKCGQHKKSEQRIDSTESHSALVEFKPVEFQIFELTDAQNQSRRSRALGIAVALALFVLLLYAASFARLIGG